MHAGTPDPSLLSRQVAYTTDTVLGCDNDDSWVVLERRYASCRTCSLVVPLWYQVMVCGRPARARDRSAHTCEEHLSHDRLMKESHTYLHLGCGHLSNSRGTHSLSGLVESRAKVAQLRKSFEHTIDLLFRYQIPQPADASSYSIVKFRRPEHLSPW